ncbi:NPCBM/NEW2 domain-containing protein [Pirellulimonas nuda]|uniref:NPCBM/NEW2 domain-containing protein n=1 Tax=Pirellulimonas nuda TaxID=2528009 RepID=UPI0018D3B93A|nr:NPCBM/NEW2 domain-containing protein [Pirellulimonas nuda]
MTHSLMLAAALMALAASAARGAPDAAPDRTAAPTIDADGRVSTPGADGETVEHEAGAFVRWGAPRESRGRWVAELADGSRVVLYPAWTRRASVSIDAERVSLRGESLLPIEAPRSALRRLLIKAADDTLLLDACTERGTPSADLLWTAAGDRLEGRLAGVQERVVKFEAAGQPVELPLAEIAALRLAGADREHDTARLAIGLADGSLLLAAEAVLDASGLRAKLAGGLEAASDNPESVVFVQTLAGGFRYLSDARPVDYVQTPYSTIKWPFAVDRSLTGGPLWVDGQRRTKGIACHSASRIIYKLEPNDRRFRSEAALEDDAGPGGSVIFRVLAIRDGKFEPLFASETVRTGDPPIAIDVDVSGAQGIALVADYADYGDQSDHAAWIDARLEEGEPQSR